MSTGPGARMGAAAAGRGHLPPATAEREHAIETLKAAFVQDRLAKDEFEARVGLVLGLRTRADLAAILADLPVVPQPPPTAARPRSGVSMNSAVTGGACLVIAANLGMLFALITGSAAGVILVAVLTVIGAAIAVGAMIVAR